MWTGELSKPQSRGDPVNRENERRIRESSRPSWLHKTGLEFDTLSSFHFLRAHSLDGDESTDSTTPISIETHFYSSAFFFTAL